MASMHLRTAAGAAFLSAFAADAQALFGPALDAFASSPWATWFAFAIATTLVIVLLLWHALDDDPPDARMPRDEGARRKMRAGNEGADERRAA